MSNNAILDAKVFAETKLLAVIPALPIAFEGVSFEPPSGMYLRTQIVISPPTDPVLNTGYYRENIEFQVFVTAPLDSGTGAVITTASTIRDAFKKGTSAYQNDTHCLILSTPQIGGVVVIGDRIICPVLIPLTAEVYS